MLSGPSTLSQGGPTSTVAANEPSSRHVYGSGICNTRPSRVPRIIMLPLL